MSSPDELYNKQVSDPHTETRRNLLMSGVSDAELPPPTVSTEQQAIQSLRVIAAKEQQQTAAKIQQAAATTQASVSVSASISKEVSAGHRAHGLWGRLASAVKSGKTATLGADQSPNQDQQRTSFTKKN